MKALIVDDERIARQELRRLLAEHPEIEIAGEARNGDEALKAIAQLAPDLVFLDIQMPGMTGFELLDRMEDVPQIIFTTAYDEYAVKAFEVNALDYLMKPIAPERLAGALRKVRTMTAAMKAARSATKQLERVFVRDGERCWIVRVDEIYLLESEGNYTRLYFGRTAGDAARPMIPKSLSALEQRLDPAVFFRAGRKHIVNLKWIDRVANGVADNLVVTLKTGQEIEMSRRQSARLKDALSL
jgi:two-component system LytT family response regulator